MVAHLKGRPRGGTGEMAPITAQDFQRIRDLVQDMFGIDLSETKMPLVESRLKSVLRKRGLTSFADYWRACLDQPSQAAISELADVLTTNHTFFWREHAQFDHMRTHALQAAVKDRQQTSERTLSIWCAAASTGEEVYTLAALLQLFAVGPLMSWECQVLGTDLSSRAIETARKGRYPKDAVALLPDGLRTAMFASRSGPDGMLSVKDAIRQRVVLRRMNLMRPTFPFKSKFDIIFCRNVMIYFDEPTRAALGQRLRSVLRPGGWLYIGAAETLGVAPGLELVAPSVYRRI